ncbi:MAG: ribonuclease P protein component [Alphaproteobacteria bacterium]
MAARLPGRLRKGAEFDTVFDRGTASSGPLFVVRVLARPEGGLRVGYAVGKRLFPKATDRNRVRRRLREAVRSADLPDGVDVILVARGGAARAAFSELVAGVRREFQRAAERAPR